MSRATVTARAGRSGAPARTLRSRRADALAGLTAAGVLPTYDLVYGSQCGLLFEQLCSKAQFTETERAWWPTEARALSSGSAATVVFREGDTGALYRFDDGTLVLAHLGDDSLRLALAGPSREGLSGALAYMTGRYPPSFTVNDDSQIPITFWSTGRFGPTPRLRRLDAASWEPIALNYTAAVREELAALMAWDAPGTEGQLLLWQGPPGTGKTWALRALASEWAPWAEFNYITDPDAFFVDDPSYMVDVLLSESYMTIDAASGDLYEEQNQGKWRVLILEDTGELLSATAKEKYGQGLSRLLNVVDGMIGQGLRVLVLVTTNDELGELNPAVLRPGRCASQIVFAALTAEEASVWAGETVSEGGTVAELYARYGASREAREAFEVEDAPEDLAASAADDDPLLCEVLRLAREPLEIEPEPVPTPGPEIAGPAVQALIAAAGPRGDRLTAALETIALAHGRTMDTVAAALVAAAATPEESRQTGDALTLAALGVLSEFAKRPEAPAAPIHVHVPEQNLSVSVEAPEIRLPDPAPVTVNVPEAVPPTVLVSVPEPLPREPAAPIHVHVAAPEPVLVPAPVVNVTVPSPPPAKPEPLRGIRVEYAADGSKIFVPVEFEEETA